MKPRRQIPRGFSLIEALMAGAILILGLTGITVMLLRGAANSRSGIQSINAANVANQTLAEFQAMGFNGLAPMGVSLDAGTGAVLPSVFDSNGLEYRRAVVVSGPGAGWPTYSIAVDVTYRDAIGVTRFVNVNGMLSRAPDAG